ncbi:MAG: VanZ family protein [Oscillospiraceae bacterium]|nr:VanZ family protein [Oscillospiraceae bacterium]
MDTLLFRPYFENPLSNVLGNWWLVSFKNGWLNNDSILNIVLFMPVTFLFTAGWNEQLERRIGLHLRSAFAFSGVFSFVLSLLIETSQLIFHRGTFQLTDLVYNTLGGCLGGMIYWCARRERDNRSHKHDISHREYGM